MTVHDAFAILRSLPPEWGASEQEVGAIESRLNVRLPAALRVLMLCTGTSEHMRWLFPDGDIAPLGELPGLKEIAEEILNEDDATLGPAFPFVVLSQHPGNFFTFVRTDGLDTDPEVMCYTQAQGVQPCLVRESIRQCIAAAVQRVVAGS
jgi:hypothetical protein